MERRPPAEPMLWLLFSAGGVVSALLLPMLVLLFALAFPLGWLAAPSHGELHALVRNPLTLLAMLGLVTLSLFHWAHRFRYLLRDALRLRRLDRLLVVLCYGGAVVGTVVAAYLLLRTR